MLALLGVAVFAGITTELLPIGLLPAIAADLRVSTARVGVLVSAYAVVVAVGSIPLTALMMRWPRRRVLCVLLTMYAVSNAIVSGTSSYAIALAARLLAGVAHAGLFSVVFTLAVTAVRPEQAGRAIAYVGAGNALALSAGVPLATALGTAVGWRAAFAVASGVLVTLAVAAVVVLPEAPAPRASAPPRVLAVLRRPALATVAITIVVLMLGHYAAYTYVSPLLLNAGVSTRAVSGAFFAYGAAGAIGLFAAGFFADRRLRPALIGAVALTASALVAFGLARPSPWGAVAALVVWGAAFGSLPTLLQTAALRATPDTPDVAPSVVNAAWNVGIAGGGILGAREILSFAPATLTYTGAALASVALVVLLSPVRHASQGAAVNPAARAT